MIDYSNECLIGVREPVRELLGRSGRLARVSCRLTFVLIVGSSG